MTYNIETQSFITEARDGMLVVLIFTTWLGRVREVYSLRASDMAQLEVETLGGSLK